MTDAPRHRSFKTPAARKEPVTFDIEGAAGVETFTCLPTVPGAAIEPFTQALLGEEGKVKAEAILGVITGCMEESEATRLMAFVEDPANIVQAQLLLEVAMFLIEEYAGRPFGARSPWSSGPTESGDSSRDSQPAEG